MAKKKIGIMGGTFNPVHIGHLILAEQAYEQFGLDFILFMPSKKPPHKKNHEILNDIHRKNMVELAIQDNPRFLLSSIELEREGTTYTVDTLRLLKKEYPEIDFYFIVGGDSICHIESWRQPEEIIKMTKILASSRYPIPDTEIKTQIQYLNELYHGQIYLLRVPAMDVSSQFLRKAISEGKSVRYLLSTHVFDYIMEHHLYQ